MLTEARTWVVATRRHSHGRATIADVAREAGVHKGTVSRALRGFSGVGPSTRDRIVAAAHRLDFSASDIATTLATGRSKTIGIVLPTMRSWYFLAVAAGASESLTPAGYRVELINLDTDSDYLDINSDHFRQLFRELGVGRGRDALLFAGTISIEQDEDNDARAQVPAALAGMPLRSVPGIFIDHRQGGRLVANHLLALGHRDIAVLDGRMTNKDNAHMWDQRTDGFRDTVRSAGFDIDNKLVNFPGDCHAEDGVRGMRAILESGMRPSAVFCHSDEMAYGAMSVMRQAGLRCPQDISVVGFDDHPMSQYWGLTTVTQHAHEQGVRAAAALVAAISGEFEATAQDSDFEELKVELIVRDTTAMFQPPRDAPHTGRVTASLRD